jgi:hypothetical protein
VDFPKLQIHRHPRHRKATRNLRIEYYRPKTRFENIRRAFSLAQFQQKDALPVPSTDGKSSVELYVLLQAALSDYKDGRFHHACYAITICSPPIALRLLDALSPSGALGKVWLPSPGRLSIHPAFLKQLLRDFSLTSFNT